MADPAGSTRGGYEVANALGSCWRVAPRLAAKLQRYHNYAKAVQTYLRAVDLYCLENGLAPSKVRIDTQIEGERMIQRITG